MKLSEVQVINFRGIVNFPANMETKSSVITGPNGTGKSGIIDAVEFLLDGRISRLEGEGNPTIHYNNWANFPKEEILSTIEAMKTLVDQFNCAKCGTYLYLVSAKPGSDPVAISCTCGKSNYTLKKRT